MTLRICTGVLFFVTSVLYSLSAVDFSSALTAAICLAVPLMFVSVVLIYSICRIKEEINNVSTETYLPNNKLMCLHVTLFSIFAIISMTYISLFSLNLPKDLESKAYLSRAIFNNCIACLMKLNLFMIDMMMLYMFVKF